jgi:hypothetical protein
LHSLAFSDTIEIKATWGLSSCISLVRPACRAAGPGVRTVRWRETAVLGLYRLRPVISCP